MIKDRKADKRERILDAALHVFARQGFYNAKISQIARHAQVADGTIYLYFENKDDLLIQLFEEKMEEIIQRLELELKTVGGDALTRIRRMVHVHLAMATEQPVLAEFITVELRQSAKFVREYDNPKFQAYLTIVRDLVEEGQRTGLLQPGLESRLLVRMIFGALDELLLTLTLASGSRAVDLSAAAESVTDVFFYGMAAAPMSHVPSTLAAGPSSGQEP